MNISVCGLEKSGLSRVAHNDKTPGSNPGPATDFRTKRDWNIAYPVTIRVLGSIPASPAFVSPWTMPLNNAQFIAWHNFKLSIVQR